MFVFLDCFIPPFFFPVSHLLFPSPPSVPGALRVFVLESCGGQQVCVVVAVRQRSAALSSCSLTPSHVWTKQQLVSFNSKLFDAWSLRLSLLSAAPLRAQSHFYPCWIHWRTFWLWTFKLTTKKIWSLSCNENFWFSSLVRKTFNTTSNLVSCTQVL